MAQDSRSEKLSAESTWLSDNSIDLVVSDVVPLACAAAHRAGIPSVCVTNFSWGKYILLHEHTSKLEETSCSASFVSMHHTLALLAAGQSKPACVEAHQARFTPTILMQETGFSACVDCHESLRQLSMITVPNDGHDGLQAQDKQMLAPSFPSYPCIPSPWECSLFHVTARQAQQ